MDTPHPIVTLILSFMISFLFAMIIIIQSDISIVNKKLDKVIATQQATTTTQLKVGN